MTKKFIYHITHYKNLPSILKTGYLFCNSLLQENSIRYKNIAHDNIQVRRISKKVPIEPYGTLHDYVPFYFAPRSPMLCAIHNGRVKGYDEGQRPIVHIVSSIEEVLNQGAPFVFTDGHAAMALSSFFNDLKYLDRIDWGIMEERYWADTPEDGDRSRRRQAEFLVHQRFKWSWVHEVGVIDEEIQGIVKKIIRGSGYNTPVLVREGWYY